MLAARVPAVYKFTGGSYTSFLSFYNSIKPGEYIDISKLCQSIDKRIIPSSYTTPNGDIISIITFSVGNFNQKIIITRGAEDSESAIYSGYYAVIGKNSSGQNESYSGYALTFIFYDNKVNIQYRD